MKMLSTELPTLCMDARTCTPIASRIDLRFLACACATTNRATSTKRRAFDSVLGCADQGRESGQLEGALALRRTTGSEDPRERILHSVAGPRRG